MLPLKSTKWYLTRKGGRHYLPQDTPPPRYPLKKLREEASKIKLYISHPHSIKGFADDLTVLSTTFCDHWLALEKIESCCSDLDLEFRPDKCVTFCYNLREMVKEAKASLSEGNTRNIAPNPVKFLGCFLGVSPQASQKGAMERISKELTESLKLIDSRPVRGEWIYKNYLAPSIYFLLAVNAISETEINSLQS